EPTPAKSGALSRYYPQGLYQLVLSLRAPSHSCNGSTLHGPTTLRNVEVESYNFGRSLLQSPYNRGCFKDENNQAVDNNVDEEGKNVEDQQVSKGDDDTNIDDAGYMRKPIEDESWFLAHEIDYPNDNEKKADVILPLQSELASPEIKVSLHFDEDIGVDEVSSAIDGVFVIGENNVESMEVRSKFDKFSENKESV
ncbi:hypothetical protein Tco_1196902, partial [Tanacetum coccineum]